MDSKLDSKRMRTGRKVPPTLTLQDDNAPNGQVSSALHSLAREARNR